MRVRVCVVHVCVYVCVVHVCARVCVHVRASHTQAIKHFQVLCRVLLGLFELLGLLGLFGLLVFVILLVGLLLVPTLVLTLVPLLSRTSPILVPL